MMQQTDMTDSTPPPTARVASIEPDEPMSRPSTSFTCRNGNKFTVTFTTNKTAAYLKLKDGKEPELLKSHSVAAGIEYGNKNYVFSEHNEHVTLMHIRGKKASETVCRKTGAN
jgi:hypothetical protein